MTKNSDEYSLHIRQKPNQQHPFQAPASTSLISINWISLNCILDIIQEYLFLPDLKTVKVRYLSDRGTYLLCHESGAPFNSKRILEVVITGPSEIFNSSPKSKMSRNETDASLRIDALEKTLMSMEASVSFIVNKLSLPAHAPGSMADLPVLHDDDEKSMGTQDMVSFGSPNFPMMQMTRTQSATIGTFARSISGMSQVPLTTENSMIKKKSLLTKYQDDLLHFAILYSNPLVDIVEKKSRVQTALLINDPVDFSNECASILQCLESHKKLLNVHIECASSDKFISIVKEKPLIMHIMCHGDFDTEKQQYFLEFENSKAELLRMYPSRLKELLSGTDLTEIKLVFINACHSEAIGRAFLELGVGCVIVSQSEHKLNDEFAKVYAKLFYDELIEGKSVSLAFENAKAQLKAVNINGSDSCCCGHSHKEDCSWYQFYKQNGKFLVNYF